MQKNHDTKFVMYHISAFITLQHTRTHDRIVFEITQKQNVYDSRERRRRHNVGLFRLNDELRRLLGAAEGKKALDEALIATMYQKEIR